jgi:hypothetical protein
MKQFFLPIVIGLMFVITAFGHKAFTLVSSEAKTVNASELTALEKNQTIGKKDGSTLTFTGKEIRLVVLTGPEDDMLSFRIQGIRNPILAVPSAAQLTILFVNVDEDMRHDLRFGDVIGEFPPRPDIAETAGTNKLAAKSDDDTLQAEQIVVKANENGQYKYFCSVPTHAKGGMWSHIAVGVKPDPNAKVPEKTAHVHSPDEDKDHPYDEKPTPNASPTPHDHAAKPSASPTPHDHQQPGGMKNMDHGGHAMKEMSSTVNIGDPMNREGSGTAWLPDSSPM